jgi:hypothetical protein
VKWLAILLSLASMGGSASPGKAQGRHCSAAKHCKKATKPKPKTKPKAKVRPRQQPAGTNPSTPGAQRDETPGSDPDAKATPTPTPKPGSTPVPGPTPAPTPTPPPVSYPSRTGVDLTEWNVRSSYRTLAAGRIDFNANNLGEDDHNLSVRGGGHEYGKIDLAPGDSDMLTLVLAAGPYTLYCSLPDHEEAGMRADITVR